MLIGRTSNTRTYDVNETIEPATTRYAHAPYAEAVGSGSRVTSASTAKPIPPNS